MGTYFPVYPNCVDYYDVLEYLVNQIQEEPLTSKEIEGILECEFGITVETPEDVQRYVFEDLKERVRTSPEGNSIIYYKYRSQLEEYFNRQAISRLFG